MKTHRTLRHSAFRLFQPSAFRLSGFFLAAFSLFLPLPAAIIYWDPGVTGTWFTPNGWRDGSATGALRNAPSPDDEARIDNGHVTISPGVSATAFYVHAGYSANSPGTLLIEGDGALVSSRLYAGRVANSNGRIIAGDYSSVTANEYAIIGYSGTGSLDIAPYGVVQTTQYFNLAQDANGRGFASVEGSLQVGTYMMIGRNGRGFLDVAHGGAVSIGSYLDIGNGAAASGSLNLAGNLSVGTYAYIGGSGTGMVTIASTGSMRVTGSTSIGNAANSLGSLDVAGIYQGVGNFLVGNNGTGTLTLRDGGTVLSGAGAITLAQASTATGVLEITGSRGGSITGTDGTTPATITSGGGSARVVFSHSDANYTFANTLAGSLAVEHNGAGFTTLTGDNNYTGGTIVRSGTLAGTTASIRGDILADGAVLLTATDAHTLTLTGTGAFSRLGEGALALAPDTNFAGSAFSMTGGAVVLTGSATLDGTRAVTLGAGVTLGGSLARTAGQSLSGAAGGGITGNLSLNNASLAIAPADPGAAPFIIGGNFTFANSTLALGFFEAGDNIIAIGGAINISGANTIDLEPGMSGTRTLTSLGALAGSDITIGGLTQIPGVSRQGATSAAAGADLRIIIESDISRLLAWTGSASANWNISDDNWDGSNNTKNYASLDTVVFDSVADAAHPANRSITLTGNMRVSDIAVSGGEDYTFGGAGGITSGTTVVTETGNPENLAGVTGKLFKSGTGTLTFANTGVNNFSGGVEITGGALVFDSGAQLGTLTTTGGAHAPITLSGGTLNPVANATLAAPLHVSTALAPASEITTPAGVTLTFAGAVSGAGTLEKTGGGSLVLSGESTHTGAVLVSAGTLATRAENLRGPIANNATLVLDDGGADDVFSGAISGNGSLTKAGPATLAFTGAATPDTFTISQGTLLINQLTSLAASSAFSIAPGAQLAGTGAFSAPQLANAGAIRVGRAADPSAPHGVMTFTGNYTGADLSEIRLDMSLNAAGVIEFDRFIINGNADGATRISLQEQPNAERLKGDTSLLPDVGDMLTVTGSVAEGAFVHNGSIEFGGGQYRWDYTLNDGAGGWRTLVVEPASALGMLDAATLLIGKASFASLENRLVAAREPNREHKKHLWATAFHRGENLAAARYDRYETTPRASANTQGIQAGIDWFTETFIFGLFVDYAKSDMHLPGHAIGSSASSTGYGVYASWLLGSLHIDTLLRFGAEKYDIRATRVAPFSTTGYSRGVSLSAGYDIPLDKAGKWSLEPAARFVYQENNNKGATDSFGRRYEVDGAYSRETRLGLRLSRAGVWKNGLKSTPYIHAGWLYEFGGEGRLVVAGERFTHNFGGGGAELGAGLLLELRRDIALQAGFAWFDTAASQGITATLGASIAW